MACLAIETFVVVAFFKGDDGEKGDRGVNGPKVTFQNSTLLYPDPWPLTLSFYSNYVVVSPTILLIKTSLYYGEVSAN